MAKAAVAVETAGKQQSEVGMTFELKKMTSERIMLPLMLKFIVFSFY